MPLYWTDPNGGLLYIYVSADNVVDCSPLLRMPYIYVFANNDKEIFILFGILKDIFNQLNLE